MPEIVRYFRHKKDSNEFQIAGKLITLETELYLVYWKTDKGRVSFNDEPWSLLQVQIHFQKQIEPLSVWRNEIATFWLGPTHLRPTPKYDIWELDICPWFSFSYEKENLNDYGLTNFQRTHFNGCGNLSMFISMSLFFCFIP